MSFEDESDKGGKKGTKPALAIDKIMKNMGKYFKGVASELQQPLPLF